MSDEQKDFKVSDKRHFDSAGKPKDRAPEDETRAPEPKAPEAGQEAAAGPNAAPDAPEPEASPHGPLPPVDFSAFVVSMGHAAMLHMGQIPDPASGEASADAELARHTIDTIAMLQEKTKGNLSPEEKNLIDHLLTELRLAYVKIFG